MSSTSGAPVLGRDPAMRRLVLLTFVLFLSYLSVAMALPVVPIHVLRGLGLSNAFAGTAVG
ncbi:arabinose transporter, partial [Thioclava sp. BHET1]